MNASRGRRKHRSALLLGGLLAVSCGWFQGLEPEARNDDPQRGVDGGDEPFDASQDSSALAPDGSDSGGGGGGGGSVGDAHSDGETEPHGPPSFGLTTNTTWHPEARRMAVTDDSALRGSQDRIWLLARGYESPRLVTKLVNVASDRWFDTTIDGITTDLDAISFSDSSSQYQRVFFGRRGKLGMYRFDDELRGSLEELSPSADYSIGSGDVAALTFIEDGARHSVVLAPALRGTAAGHYCIFENTDTSPAWDVTCSGNAIVAPGADMVGVRVDREAQFYFRNLDHRLSRLRRVAVGNYALEAIATPENADIGPSLAVSAGGVPERLDIAVIGARGRIWNTTLRASAAQGPLSEAPSWLLMPELPDGASASSSHAALAALWISTGDGPALTLYALDSLGALHGIADETDDGWHPNWSRPYTPGGGQTISAIGVLAKTDAFGGLPRLFVSGGGRTATTLHEITFWLISFGFLDHLRPQPEDVPALRGPFAETTLAMGPDEGFVAGSRRDGSPPFRLSLNATIDGASSWGTQEQLLTPEPAVQSIDVLPSVVEPSAGYGGGRVHLVSLEVDLPSSCVDADPASRVVYRRAPNALALVAANEPSVDVYVMKPPTRQAHPSFVLTEEDGEATAHVLYADLPGNLMRYWHLPAHATASPPSEVLNPAILEVGPSFLVQGPSSTVYGGTVANGYARLCNLDTRPLGVAACTTIGDDIPSVVDVPFGAAHADPQGSCPPVEKDFFKCLRDARPLSLSAHSTVTNRVYAAYAAPYRGRTAVFFTHSTTRSADASLEGDASFGPWTPPVVVNDVPDPYDRYSFDPEIVFESPSGLLITYKVLTRDAGRERVDLYAAVSDDEGGSFRNFRLRDSWDPEQAVWDCRRQAWTLGDSGRPSAVGSRSLHVVRGGSPSAGRMDTRWLSTSTLE